MLRASVGLAAVALLTAGCHIASVATGETLRETTSVEFDKAEMARVEIRMEAGELRVQSGTPKLLEADFDYNVPGWKPVVDYHAGATRSDLTVRQPKNAGHPFDGAVYKWAVKLNGHVPLDIVSIMGAGEANMELGDMNLRRVEVNIGAGDLKIDLRGEPLRDYTVQIRGGVGEATVYLPRDAAISATAKGGIGDINVTGLEKRDGVWINPDRIHAPVTVHLDVKGGVGAIRLIR